MNNKDNRLLSNSFNFFKELQLKAAVIHIIISFISFVNVVDNSAVDQLYLQSLIDSNKIELESDYGKLLLKLNRVSAEKLEVILPKEFKMTMENIEKYFPLVVKVLNQIES